MSPVRIQLRRTKGWRMPPDTVKVDRSTRWGNPWPVGEWGPLDRKAPDAEGAVGLFCAMLDDPQMRDAVGYPQDLSPLRGKNLACWCSGWCHANVLLELANTTPVGDASGAELGPGKTKTIPTSAHERERSNSHV